MITVEVIAWGIGLVNLVLINKPWKNRLLKIAGFYTITSIFVVRFAIDSNTEDRLLLNDLLEIIQWLLHLFALFNFDFTIIDLHHKKNRLAVNPILSVRENGSHIRTPERTH